MAGDRYGLPLHVVTPGTDDPNDAELGRALIAGERWAADAAWHRYAPVVFGIVNRALGPGADCEDVTQEIFYRLFAKVNTLRNPAALRSFVVSFAIRIVKWELRRRRVRRWVTLSDRGTVPELPTDPVDTDARDALRRFYRLLDRLSARERLVFVLRHLEQMTLDEIATAVGVSIATVKRELVRSSRRATEWTDTDPELAALFVRRERGRDAKS